MAEPRLPEPSFRRDSLGAGMQHHQSRASTIRGVLADDEGHHAPVPQSNIRLNKGHHALNRRRSTSAVFTWRQGRTEAITRQVASQHFLIDVKLRGLYPGPSSASPAIDKRAYECGEEICVALAPDHQRVAEHVRHSITELSAIHGNTKHRVLNWPISKLIWTGTERGWYRTRLVPNKTGKKGFVPTSSLMTSGPYPADG